MLKTTAVLVLAISLAALPGPSLAASPSGNDINVRVEREGNVFTVDLDMLVPASQDETWEVLTDFDKMAQILSNVDSSHVVTRDGNLIQVAQKSHATVGLVKLSLDNLRQIELTPNREIRSRLVKGDLKSSDFTTRITGEGSGTRVTVKGKFTVGALSGTAINEEAVAKQTRRQYDELRQEVVRRKGNVPPPPCLLAKTCEQQPAG